MTLEQLIKENPPTTTIQQASSIMNVTPLFLRHALLQGKFSFGVGVEMKHNEFYINTARFIKYMKGEIN